MWAHYAQNHTGVVIEIDEAELAKYNPNFRATTINYRDTPYEGLLNTLSLAARRGKFRDHALLQKNILRAAYLTKQKCWEYELKKRLIVQDSHIRKENNLMLLDLPITCVSALIVGYYSDEKTRNNVECLSERIDANYYEAKIGRTTAQPFFVDSFNRIYKFDNATISEVDYYCEECNEPIDKAKFLCSWCSVSEEDLTYAASHNSLGILLRHGLLDDYMKIFMSI